MPSNYITGANNYDAAYILADTQAVTTDAAGVDSGAAAITLDLQDYVGSQFVAHIRYTQAQYTDETYKFEIQSSATTNFAAYNTEKNTDLGIAADVPASSNKYFCIGAFSPTRRYVRVYFNTSGSAPSLTVDKVWISPLG